MRPRGGIIGASPAVSKTAAIGVWTMREVENYRRLGEWATVPDAPTSVVGAVGNGQVSLTWTEPASNGSAITDYIVQFSSDNGSSWQTYSDGVSAATSATVFNLTNATTYLLQVAAVNSVGRGEWSASVSVTPATLMSLTYLLVGGGGGGGGGRGGGGGAGGYLYGTGDAVLGSSLSVVVGSGGGSAQNGQGSSFALASGTITAIGGGRGADGLMGLYNGVGQAGGNGGSGGGGSGYPPVGAGGSGSQGNPGGSGYGNGEPYNGGGGGGAGGVGGSWVAANGGVGRSSESSFLAAASAGIDVGGTRYIAAGGAAGSYNVTPGGGGSGGGGDGGNTNAVGANGVANTGSGGGGGGNAANGGSGGSGIVILRVADTFTATTTGSPSVYVTGGYRYFKFTQSGTITFAAATAPSVPTAVAGTAIGGSSASVYWTAPSSNGGAAITDYIVQFKRDNESTWTTFADGTSTATSATVTGLSNGIWVFRVAAVNSVGTGDYSSASSPVTLGSPEKG